MDNVIARRTSNLPVTDTVCAEHRDGGASREPAVTLRATLVAMAAGAETHAASAACDFVRSARLGDGVLYVGMNSADGQCDREARVLQHVGSGVRVVVAHGERRDGVGADHVKVGDRVFDLTTLEGAHDFAVTLGLPPDRTARIADVLANAPAGSRDELAGIAEAWGRAERGGDCPSRVVLSGHCAGGSIYDGGDEDLGNLPYASVYALADAMPGAAAQIEDIMFSACSSGRQPDLAELRAHFPNLATAWGYGGKSDFHSPTGATALDHIREWEGKTRGRAQDLHTSARNASTWSIETGYIEAK